MTETITTEKITHACPECADSRDPDCWLCQGSRKTECAGRCDCTEPGMLYRHNRALWCPTCERYLSERAA